jgi:hypothetical protein
LVEHDLAKVGVAGSSPVFRSFTPSFSEGGSLPPARKSGEFFLHHTLVAELVDAQDLKSCLQKCGYGFDSRLGYFEALLVPFFLRTRSPDFSLLIVRHQKTSVELHKLYSEFR